MIGVVLGGLLAGTAQGQTPHHRVRLPANLQAGTWRSPAPLPKTGALNLAIYQSGVEIDGRGKLVSTCSYELFTKGIALTFSACGPKPVVIHYVSPQPLTVIYWLA